MHNERVGVGTLAVQETVGSIHHASVNWMEIQAVSSATINWIDELIEVNETIFLVPGFY